MSHLVVFVMVCIFYFFGQWVNGDGVTHPIGVAGIVLLAHWVLTK